MKLHLPDRTAEEESAEALFLSAVRSDGMYSTFNQVKRTQDEFYY